MTRLDDNTLKHIQRSLDGEADRAHSASVARLTAVDAQGGEVAGRLKRLDDLCRARCEQQSRTDADDTIAAIMDRLPAASPARSTRSFRFADVAVAGCILIVVGLLYGLAGSMDDVLPLAVISVASIMIGIVLIAATRRHFDEGASRLDFLFSWRLPVAAEDRLLWRLTGFAIMVGGIWAAIDHFI